MESLRPQYDEGRPLGRGDKILPDNLDDTMVLPIKLRANDIEDNNQDL